MLDASTQKYRKFIFLFLAKSAALFGLAAPLRGTESEKPKLHILTPRDADWHIQTDVTARNSGSNSRLNIRTTDDESALLFDGVLGTINGHNGPVGFVRATTPILTDASAYNGLKVPLELRTENLVVTILLQDAAQAGSSEWFEANLTLSETNIGTVRFTEFKRMLRGRQIPGAQLDPSRLRQIGVQVARSVQNPALRDGGDFDFSFRLTGDVLAE